MKKSIIFLKMHNLNSIVKMHKPPKFSYLFTITTMQNLSSHISVTINNFHIKKTYNFHHKNIQAHKSFPFYKFFHIILIIINYLVRFLLVPL